MNLLHKNDCNCVYFVDTCVFTIGKLLLSIKFARFYFFLLEALSFAFAYLSNN